MLVTLPPIGERSIVMSVSVRDHISSELGPTHSIFTEFLVRVTYGRGSVSSGDIVIYVMYFRFYG